MTEERVVVADAAPCDAGPELEAEAAAPSCIFVESFSRKCALAVMTQNYVVCPNGVSPPPEQGCVGSGREWCCPPLFGP